MKQLLYIILLTIAYNTVQAAHITGGEMVYTYLGPGAAAGTKKYRITLFLFRDENAPPSAATMPGSVVIGIFNLDNGQAITGSPFTVQKAAELTAPNLPLPPCINNPPSPQLRYNYGIYNIEVDLQPNTNGYAASYQTCCRINPLMNVFNQAGTGGAGSTYECTIPTSINDNSPRFAASISVICKSSAFTLDFSATDADGDVLRYSFCDAYNGGGAVGSVYNTPAAPPYGSLQYINGFNGLAPLGNNASINPNTGIISGIAPAPGKYVVAVCIDVIRAGVKIASHKKDFIVTVNDCSIPDADLGLDNVTCDGFTQTFQNLANDPGGLVNSYFWDFGVPSQSNDTSILQSPTFTYPDTGVYTVTLIVNKGQQCSDTARKKIGIYPGFFPNFTSTGVCFTSPINFFDASTTAYGFVNSWRWDFGNTAILNDTSIIKNPTYTYPAPGPYTVTLVVTNSKGCIDTVDKQITLIDRPVITLPFKDTLICSIDTLQLQSSASSGNATWLPNYNIISPNTYTPLVYPKVTTTYTITVNDQGCIQQDTVRVNVKDFVTIDIMPDTSICLTDAFRIRNTTDALNFVWTPANTLNNASIKEPIATPTAASTKYLVLANIGKCQSRDSMTVTTNPYPVVTADSTATICFGKQVQLYGATNAPNYQWIPVTGLSNPNSLNPIAQPIKTTQYILIATNTMGCIKPARDTVTITVIPPINAFAGNDTTIVAGQPLQLNATGGTIYNWLPTSFLNNATIPNPIAVLNNSFKYAVRVADVNGCFAIDTINITVFTTAPDIFVPTVFTPNNDGTNDVLIPIPVGLRQYDFFEVYNRWGQRMYRTTQVGVGWNGVYRNVPQGTETFVWQVQGTDYTGKKIFKKGTVILVR